MSEYQVTLPKLGESILSATIVQWFKKVGDRIEKDEPLLEVATDKVNSEIPSPAAGIIGEIFADVDVELDVGAPLAAIRTEGASSNEAQRPVSAPVLEKPREVVAASSGCTSSFFSPVVLKLAEEHRISMEELKKIPATGVGGRVSKRDLENYLESKKTAPQVAVQEIIPEHGTPPAEIERVKMSTLRKAIADNMVRSFYEAPHATLITEVDVTDILKVIQKEKEAFFERHNAKLTITSFIGRAIGKALFAYPLLNSSLEKDTIVVKKFVNLGIAVSVPQGLIVPVVKNCEKLGLTTLAKKIHELSQKARSGGLALSDIQEGTISMTNFGMTGVLMGVPIIRYPEVAIIGIGAVHKKVVVMENDQFGIRSMMHVSLTFDHRILDGIYGCEFLAQLKKHIEEDLKVD